MKLTSLTEADWTQVLSLSTIPIMEGDRFTRVVCPISLSSPVVACFFSATSLLNDSWQFVGYVSGEIRSGLTVGGGSDSRLGKRKNFYANRLQIFQFDLISDNYSLVFDLNHVGNVGLFAWEYTGVIE